MLFLRVKKISQNFCGSPTVLAKQLGLQPPTFLGYLNEKRQDNLWPLLPKILELLPQVSRIWLYFGEGDMLDSNTHSSSALELERENNKLKSELSEERLINKKLINRLLLEGSPQHGSEGGKTGETAG